jgi:hypothetical protein
MISFALFAYLIAKSSAAIRSLYRKNEPPQN